MTGDSTVWGWREENAKTAMKPIEKDHPVLLLQLQVRTMRLENLLIAPTFSGKAGTQAS